MPSIAHFFRLVSADERRIRPISCHFLCRFVNNWIVYKPERPRIFWRKAWGVLWSDRTVRRRETWVCYCTVLHVLGRSLTVPIVQVSLVVMTALTARRSCSTMEVALEYLEASIGIVVRHIHRRRSFANPVMPDDD